MKVKLERGASYEVLLIIQAKEDSGQRQWEWIKWTYSKDTSEQNQPGLVINCTCEQIFLARKMITL